MQITSLKSTDADLYLRMGDVIDDPDTPDTPAFHREVQELVGELLGAYADVELDDKVWLMTAVRGWQTHLRTMGLSVPVTSVARIPQIDPDELRAEEQLLQGAQHAAFDQHGIDLGHSFNHLISDLAYCRSLATLKTRALSVTIVASAVLSVCIVNVLLLLDGGSAFLGPYLTGGLVIVTIGLMATAISTSGFLGVWLPRRIDQVISELERLGSH